MKIKAWDIRNKTIKEVELDFETLIQEGCPVGVVPIIEREGWSMKSMIRCSVCHRRRKPGHEKRVGTDKAYDKNCVKYSKKK